MVAILAFFKMVSFQEYWLFLRAVFWIEQLPNVFNMFFCVFNFWPKVTIFWKGYSHCLVAIFAKGQFSKGYSLFLVAISGKIQNGLIFRISDVSSSRFFAQNNCNVLQKPFQHVFFAFSTFDPKSRFCKGYYSLCLVATFGKGTIFQRVQPFLGGHFWQFLKWSYFSNISCFFEPFFLHRTTAMCCRNVLSNFFFAF